MHSQHTLGRLALAAVLLLPAAANSAQGEAGESERDVRVRQVVIDCDGEDCPNQHHHAHALALHHGGKHFAHPWLGGPHAAGGGFLGVGLTELTPELRRHFGVPEEAGVMVSRVVDDSAAALAGLQVGDIITGVDGEPTASGYELARSIRSRGEGESVLLEVWRQGKMETFTATLDEREAAVPRKHLKVMRCEDGEGDCPHRAEIERLCAGAEDCRVEVDCSGDECTCTVNGSPVECGDLAAFHGD